MDRTTTPAVLLAIAVPTPAAAELKETAGLESSRFLKPEELGPAVAAPPQ